MNEAKTTYPPHICSLLALILPPGVGLFVANMLSAFLEIGNTTNVMLAGTGIVSVLIGVRWFAKDELGLRGGRPFMAGVGFAFLGWVGLLIARTIAVPIGPPSADLGLTFLSLLIFEATCVQLWIYGLLFRTLTAWRHPVNAAIISGIVFGAFAFLAFRETFLVQRGLYPVTYSIFFFIVWGIFYGMIRLRTGSIFGMILIQATQTLTVWYLITPVFPEEISKASSLIYLYGIAGVFFLFFTWRLFPKLVTDYRI